MDGAIGQLAADKRASRSARPVSIRGDSSRWIHSKPGHSLTLWLLSIWGKTSQDGADCSSLFPSALLVRTPFLSLFQLHRGGEDRGAAAVPAADLHLVLGVPTEMLKVQDSDQEDLQDGGEHAFYPWENRVASVHALS